MSSVQCASEKALDRSLPNRNDKSTIGRMWLIFAETTSRPSHAASFLQSRGAPEVKPAEWKKIRRN